MEKRNKAGQEDILEWGWGRYCNLKQMAQEDLSKYRKAEREQVTDICRQSLPSRGHWMCKGPEVGAFKSVWRVGTRGATASGTPQVPSDVRSCEAAQGK